MGDERLFIMMNDRPFGPWLDSSQASCYTSFAKGAVRPCRTLRAFVMRGHYGGVRWAATVSVRSPMI